MAIRVLDLGSISYDSSLDADVQAVFGGATPAETLAIIKRMVRVHLRDYFLTHKMALVQQAMVLANQVQQDAERVRLEAGYPEG